MASREKPKEESRAGKGTPSESDRKVLERAERPVAVDVPDVTPVDGGEKIEPVDLSLHGDGINHWQDEPISRRKAQREREGTVPTHRKKG